jgi:hypothetical protein
MNIEIFALCDAANESAGKISLLGVFDQANAPSEPFKLPPFCIVGRFRFSSAESGQKKIIVNIIDQDGKTVLPDVALNVSAQAPDDTMSSTCQILVNIPQLQLPHFGEYAIRLVVDGRQERTTPLYAKKLPPPA